MIERFKALLRDVGGCLGVTIPKVYVENKELQKGSKYFLVISDTKILGVITKDGTKHFVE